MSIDGFTAEDLRLLKGFIEDNQRVFFGGNDVDLPDINQIKPSVHLGYGVFKAETEEYSVSFDGGGGMSRLPSGKGYTILRVLSGEYPYDFEAVRETLEKLQASL